MNKPISSFMCFILAFSLILPARSCGDKVQEVINVSANVATQAGLLISTINPVFGGELAAVGNIIRDAGNIYAKYKAADVSSKPGIASELHGLLNTVTENLQTILTDAHVKDPSHVQEITVFVAIANSAVNLMLSLVPATTPAGVQAAIKMNSLPIVPGAKKASDLASTWNKAVAKKYQVK